MCVCGWNIVQFAKAMGFEYKYPLLYSKLVEFCFRLPIELKRRHGVNRYLMGRYLAQYLPEKYYNHRKINGLTIIPATFQKSKQFYAQGKFDDYFKDLPFSKYFDKNLDKDQVLGAKIHAYMLKYYLESSRK